MRHPEPGWNSCSRPSQCGAEPWEWTPLTQSVGHTSRLQSAHSLREMLRALSRPAHRPRPQLSQWAARAAGTWAAGTGCCRQEGRCLLRKFSRGASPGRWKVGLNSLANGFRVIPDSQTGIDVETYPCAGPLIRSSSLPRPPLCQAGQLRSSCGHCCTTPASRLSRKVKRRRSSSSSSTRTGRSPVEPATEMLTSPPQG